MLESPDRADADLSSLRLAVTGAAVVPVALVERMQTELCFDSVLTAFGHDRVRRGHDVPDRRRRRARREQLRPAVPGLELRIARPGSSEELPAGEEGELLLRGDTVMLGYLDDPEATAEADRRRRLAAHRRRRPRRRARLPQDHRPAQGHVHLRRLQRLPGRGRAGAGPARRRGRVRRGRRARRAAGRGRQGLRRTPGRVPRSTEDDVLAFCRERLANFKVPREVEFVDDLPRNLAGKVLKRDLRGATHDGPTTGGRHLRACATPVAVVTLNRPEYRNAQNSAMTYALDAAFTRAVDDDEVKVIVLAGNGKHFCAGHDIGTPGPRRRPDLRAQGRDLVGPHRQAGRRPALRPRVGGLPRHVPALARDPQADHRDGAGRLHRRRADAGLGRATSSSPPTTRSSPTRWCGWASRAWSTSRTRG